MARIAVLGAGAWGTSIASVLSARLEVALWARDAAQADTISRTRRNERYLPGLVLPSSVGITADLSSAISGAQLVLAATPVAGLRHMLQRLDGPLPVVWLCKGFEEGTGLLPHQVAAETLGENVKCGALSGPSFAEEVARGLPCALTLASRAADFARLSAALGGQPETVMGLTGAGDLILTATGDLSRNRRVGLELARGNPLQEILSQLGHVAEGVRSAKEVSALAKKKKVDMPVSDAVSAVLEGQLKPA